MNNIIEFVPRADLCELCRKNKHIVRATYTDDPNDPESDEYDLYVCDECELNTRIPDASEAA
jgi:hypothetical protein